GDGQVVADGAAVYQRQVGRAAIPPGRRRRGSGCGGAGRRTARDRSGGRGSARVGGGGQGSGRGHGGCGGGGGGRESNQRAEIHHQGERLRAVGHVEAAHF